MTNLELAQQQGNQAAPNLLAAATAGELGGGGSVFPSLSTAGFVMANMSFTISSDQADEAAADTIYANCKLVTDNHLDFFMLTEEYTDGSEGSEATEYAYVAFSERILTHAKTLIGLVPEVAEIFDNIEPDELCAIESETMDLLAIVYQSVLLGFDELPPATSGMISLVFAQPLDSDLIVVPPMPAGSSVYFQQIIPATLNGSSSQGLVAFSYYAESLLDTPVKLDKTYMYILDSESEPEPEPEP